ncbi:MAG: hypothetical protein QM589_12400 [Thermomicrobiales bacterium]
MPRLDTVADVLNWAVATGVVIALEDDGLRLSGHRPDDGLRAAIVAGKPGIVAARQLADRLETGWNRCDEAPPGPERDRLEGHWVGLLHDLERIYDRPIRAGP